MAFIRFIPLPLNEFCKISNMYPSANGLVIPPDHEFDQTDQTVHAESD
jgi:hypothetical protein